MLEERVRVRAMLSDERVLDALVIGLSVLHVVLAAVTVSLARSRVILDDDVLRFREIALQPGRLWRDFPVEYAPVEGAVVRILGGASSGAVATRIVLLALAADLLTAWAMGWGWGRRARNVYLAMSLPVLTFMFARFDFVPVALATLGVAALQRRRASAGGSLLGVAVLAKVWPIVLVPLLFRRGRAAVGCVLGTVVVGVLVWVGYGGAQAPVQVASFRGAAGWQIESTIGAIVWTFSDSPVALDAGAARVGTVPPWATGALALGMLATLAAVWWRARGRDGKPQMLGAPAAAAVGALLLFSPVFSIQYVSWLLPWGLWRRRSATVEWSRPGWP